MVNKSEMYRLIKIIVRSWDRAAFDTDWATALHWTELCDGVYLLEHFEYDQFFTKKNTEKAWSKSQVDLEFDS